jgi:predicted dehydrogenase
MEKVKVGIVGVGWISQVVHLPILTKLKEAELVAICDRDKSRARLVAEKYGIRKVYADLDKMLAEEEFQALVVATSTDAHKEATLAGLHAGRDVLVEKPIARTYAEALAMAEAAKETRRILMVGMNHRFRPDTMILKSFLQGKEIGKLQYVKVSWLRKQSSNSAWLTQKEKSGGGVLVDLGIVMLDVAFWLMDYPDVRKVSAVHFRQKTRSVEDTSLLTVSMKNGAVVNLEVSWSMCVTDDVYACQVFGNEGSASLNPLRIHKEQT